MKMDDAIVEFGFDCKVRKLSEKTVANYQKQLRYIEKYLKDEFQITEVEEIKPYHIKQFLAILRIDPRRRILPSRALCGKMCFIRTGFSSASHPSKEVFHMLILTIDTIPGKTIEPLGMVKGSTIQTVNAFRDIGAGLKTLVGGELKKYNEMMDHARSIATDRMVEEAKALGADAIVGARYATSGIMQSAAEVMAYGTAVKCR